MKTDYKFIYFDWVISDNVYLVRNNKTKRIIGCLEFYKPWRQWVLSAIEAAVFNDQCLKDIIHFMEQLKQKEV